MHRCAAAEYEQIVRDWDKNANNPRKANRLFDRAHNLFKRLRDSEQGHAGIAALMNDPNPGVRVTAASHSLRWQEAEAIATLETLDNDVRSRLHGVSAKYTSAPTATARSTKTGDVRCPCCGRHRSLSHCPGPVG